MRGQCVKMNSGQKWESPLCRQNHAQKVMKVQITENHMRGGGGDSLIKVGMQRVQNLGQTKCLTENLMPMQKSALRPNDWACFHEI